LKTRRGLGKSIYNGIESGKEEEWFFVSTLILLAQTKGPRQNKIE
jgi:hypothetical protein